MNVEVHIEELVLRGLPPGHGARVGDTVRRELSRLFSEEGVPPALLRGGDIPRLDAGAFDTEPGLGSHVVGERIARSLYEGMAG